MSREAGGSSGDRRRRWKVQRPPVAGGPGDSGAAAAARWQARSTGAAGVQGAQAPTPARSAAMRRPRATTHSWDALTRRSAPARVQGGMERLGRSVSDTTQHRRAWDPEASPPLVSQASNTVVGATARLAAGRATTAAARGRPCSLQGPRRQKRRKQRQGGAGPPAGYSGRSNESTPCQAAWPSPSEE
jgi:hypothetical protein